MGFLQFEKLALVGNRLDHLAHVIGFGGAVRDDGVELVIASINWVMAGQARRLLPGGQWQIGEEPAHFEQGLDVVGKGGVGHRGNLGVGGCAAQLFLGDDLVGHGFDHVRAGHEHVARILDHIDEVGHGRGIDRAACAGAHDHRNLRHRARRLHIAPEDVGIAAQSRHALLNAGAARIVEPDHRRAVLHGQVHDLANLLCMRFAQRAAEDGKVLGKHIDHATIDRAPTGDDAVAGDDGIRHAEIGGPMGDEHVIFFERPRIEQHVEAFAGGELALAMLGIDAALTAAEPRFAALMFEGGDDVLHWRLSGSWAG